MLVKRQEYHLLRISAKDLQPGKFLRSRHDSGKQDKGTYRMDDNRSGGVATWDLEKFQEQAKQLALALLYLLSLALTKR